MSSGLLRKRWPSSLPKAWSGFKCVACRSRLRKYSVSASMAMNQLEGVVEAIHSSATQLVLYISGGGSKVISDLLSVPGASNTMLEASVPYARESLSELLGQEPARYVSEETATAMATVAYRRAAQLSAMGSSFIGVGVSAGLRTGSPRRGGHKMYIACHTGTVTHSYTLELQKGARTRSEEELVAANAALCVIAEHSVVAAARPNHAEFIGTLGSEQLQLLREKEIGDPLQALLDGHIASVEIFKGVVTVDAPRRNGVYLAGSFNPLHDGHKELLRAACQVLERPGAGCFELCVHNADKGSLDLNEVRRRVAQFEKAELPIVLTRASLFTQKVQLFRKATFVLGYDTAVRIVMPKYYSNSERAMELQFSELKWAGSRFLVGGRKDADSGRFLTMADISVPSCLEQMGLFEEIPESLFRNDISSTELRQQVVSDT